MEFRLNKIDPELRQKINDKTSEGKIHHKENKIYAKDCKQEDSNSGTLWSKEPKKIKRKKIIIKAEKSSKVEVQAFKDGHDIELQSGSYLDTKK